MTAHDLFRRLKLKNLRLRRSAMNRTSARSRLQILSLEDRLAPATFVAGSIQGQDGWTGGTIPISASVNQTVIQPGTAFSGVGSWQISNNTSAGNHNGAFSGWPFAPGLSVTAGHPSSGAGANQFNATFYFRSASLTADGSNIEVDLGTADGTDRNTFLAITNDTDGDGGLKLRMSEPDGTTGNFFATQIVATGLTRGTWHRIDIVAKFFNGTGNDTFSVSLDGVPLVNPNAASPNFNTPIFGTFEGFRDGISQPYALSNRLFFRSGGAPSSFDASFVDTAAQGFLFDNVSYQVSNQATPTVALASYYADFEAQPSTVYVGETGDFAITTDVGPVGLSAGDTVTWNPTGTEHPAGAVAGRVFDVEAFTSIQSAINAVTSGGTVNVTAGTYAENVVLNKQATLRGAQFGVDARGRVVGAPNPASETIVNPTTGAGRPLELQDLSDNSVVDGFTLIGSLNGPTGAIESTTGPTDNIQILNNHVAIAAGFTASPMFLNRSAIDATINRNEFIKQAGSSQTVFFDGPDLFHGMHFTNNNVLNAGAAGGTGLFIDGNHNWAISATPRIALMKGNRFEGFATGANIGSRSFGLQLTPNAGEISENTFINNTVNGLQGGPQNALITRNTFNNSGNGLALTSFGNLAVDRGAQNNSITENFFLNNATTDVFFSNVQAPSSIATNRLFGNSLGSATAVSYGGTEIIQASGNWWGNATGPTVGTNPGGAGGNIGGAGAANVDFSPWLDTGVDQNLVTPGFQGSFALLHVQDTSPQSTLLSAAGHIQEGVDLVTAGGVVDVLPGAYDLTGSPSAASGVDIPKALTLQAADFVDVTPDNTTTILRGVDAGGGGFIDVRINSADVRIEGFTIDLNGAANTRTIGGIEANGNPNLQNIRILNNRFELLDADPVAFAFGDYAFRTGGPHNFSGLQINNNQFIANGPNGGLGIFFNPDAGVGAKQFNGNTFSGKLLQGISVDTASHITIDGNTLNSTLTTGLSDNPKMIRVMPFGAGTQSNIVISNNNIGTAGANMGGRQGIIIGSTTGTVTDATLTNNVVNNTSLRALFANNVTTLNLTNFSSTGNASGGSVTNSGQINLTTTNLADNITLSGNSFSTGVMQSVSYSNSAVSSLDVFALDGDDVINVSPATTAENVDIDINGGNPVLPASPGDTLNFITPVGQTATLTTGLPGAGVVQTTGGYTDVDFNNIETFNASGAVVINAGAGNNAIVVRKDAGDNIEVVIDGLVVLDTPLASLTSLTVNGNGGDDTLTLDYSFVGGFFNLPVAFHGGANTATGDELVINNALVAATTVTHTFVNANDGNVNIDGTVITYTGLEPVTDNMDAANRIFTFTGGAETITLADGLGATMDIDSTLSESVNFPNPTVSLTINAGSGDDIVHITSVDVGFTADLNINGDAATDTVNLNAALSGLNSLSVSAENINVNAAASAGAVSLTGTAGTGLIDINADVTAGTSLTISNTAEVDLAAGVDLTANGGAVAANTGVTLIDLSGAGGTNVIGATTTVNLAALSDTGTPAELEINAGADITLSSVTIDNLLDINLDTGVNDAATLNANGAIAAGSITADAQGTNDTMNFASTVTSTTGSIAINQSNVVDFNGDVTAATGLTISNVNTEVDLTTGVDLTANGGDVLVNSGVAAIDLSGAGGTNIVTASGAVNLAAVTDTGGADSLTINSGTNTTLAPVTIGGQLTINLDTGADDAATLNANAAISAGGISADGQGINDTMNFASTVTSTIGSIVIDDVNIVDLDADVTAAAGIVISDVNTEIDLAANVDLTGSNGTVLALVGVTQIDLSGVAGTNVFTANGGTGMIQLADVVDSGTPVGLTIDADQSVVVSNITLNSGVGPVIAILANQDGVGGGAGDNFFQVTGTTVSTTNETAGAISLTVNTGGGGTGDALLRSLAAGTTAGRVTVNVNAGEITDADADGLTEITAFQAVLAAGAGIGVGNALETTVAQLDVVNTTSGGIFITDTAGGLTLTNLVGANAVDNGVGGPAAVPGGTSFIQASSPLTFAANAITAGGMTYTALDSAGTGDDLTVNGGVTVRDTTSTLIMNAGDNLLSNVGSTVRASSTLTINGDAGNADAGVGSTMNIFGNIISDTTSISITGNTDNDFATIDSNGGVLGDNGTVNNVDTGIFSGFTVNLGAGVDTLSFDDSGDVSADSFTIAPTTIDVGVGQNYFDNTIGLTYANLETVNIQTSSIVTGDGTQGDTITVSALNAGTTYNLDGNDPTTSGPVGPGDVLIVTPTDSLTVYEKAGNYVLELANGGNLNVQEFETIDVTPGNGVLNVVGDEGQGTTGGGVGVNEADQVVVTGTATNEGTLQLAHAGVLITTVVTFDSVTDLNVDTFDSDDQVTLSPFATASQTWEIDVDVNAGAGTADRLTNNSVAGLFEDTSLVATGLGAGRIDVPGIGSATTDNVVTFTGVEDVVANANAGDDDNLTIELTAGNNSATFLFDPDAGDDDIQIAGLFDVVVDTDNYDDLTVNGNNGDDQFNIALVGAGGAAAGTLPIALNLNGGAPNASDTLILTGNAGLNDDFTITPGANSQAGTAQIAGTDNGTTSFTGIENITLNGASGVGADSVTMVGTGANNAITLNGAGAAAGTVRVDAGPLVTFTGLGSDASAINLNGLDGSDNFSVTPGLLAATTAINVDGGDPTGSDTVVVSGTTAVDTVTVSPTEADAATIAILGAATVDVVSTEHLKYNGRGGNDELIFVTPPDPDAVTITPGATSDSGHIDARERLAPPETALLSLDYVNLGVFGQLTLEDASGLPTDLLELNGTNADDLFELDGSTVQIISPLSNAPRTVVINLNDIIRPELRGLGGNDHFDVFGPLAFDFGAAFEGDDGPGNDVLHLLDPLANVTIDLEFSIVDGFNSGFELDYSGIDVIDVFANTFDVEMIGTTGDDELAVTPIDAESAKVVLTSSSPSVGSTPTVNLFEIGTLNVDLDDGDDRLVVNGTNAGDVIEINDLLVTVGTRETVNYFNIEDLLVNGLSGNDTFNVTPSPTTSISVDGGDPIGGANGDRINIDPSIDPGLIEFLAGPTIDSGSFAIVGMLPISIIRIDSMSYQTPSAQLIPDPLLPGKFMLVLVGSDANDFISVRPMPFSSVGMLAQSYAVNIGGGPSLLFDFVTGHIKIDANAGHDNIYIYPKIKNPTIINGGAGNDTIFSGMGNDLITGGPGNDSMFAGLGKDELVETGDVNMTLVQGTVFVNGSMTGGLGTDVLVKNSFEGARLTGGASGNTLDATAFTAPVFLFGLGGNDVLRGGTKSDVLVGGDDQDMLVGNNGRDLLIGGLGLDLLEGGAHDDILIGGETSFDTDVAALQSIMAEWTRPNITYKGRILHLQGSPGGKNGTILLTNLTVFDDAGAVDTLRGQTYFDWFFNSVNDVLVDPFATETVTNIP